jgi:hypothetical protein
LLVQIRHPGNRVLDLTEKAISSIPSIQSPRCYAPRSGVRSRIRARRRSVRECGDEIGAPTSFTGMIMVSFRPRRAGAFLPCCTCPSMTRYSPLTRVCNARPQKAHSCRFVPSSKVTHKLPRKPYMNSRMVLAFVSITDSITSLPAEISDCHRYRCLMDVHAYILPTVHCGAPSCRLSRRFKPNSERGALFIMR